MMCSLGASVSMRSQETGQFRTAIAQLAGVSDFAREFAGKTKGRRRDFHPAQDDATPLGTL